MLHVFRSSEVIYKSSIIIIIIIIAIVVVVVVVEKINMIIFYRNETFLKFSTVMSVLLCASVRSL